MVKIKEGFKGERLVSLPEELLASYRREPLINNLYVRKIGFFPRVKYHFLQKEHGCDYAMLIYCTAPQGWEKGRWRGSLLRPCSAQERTSPAAAAPTA